MKAEAIKRGEHYSSEFDVDEDDEKVAMTVSGADKTSIEDEFFSELEIMNSNRVEVEHNLGFLKTFQNKGNIQMLSHEEINYLKTLLKTNTDIWESKSTLHDLFRHCKFTIRKLTRQMANIDNRDMFRSHKKVNRKSTLLMVYRAELLHSALGDAEKVLKLLAQLICSEKDLDKIIAQKTSYVYKESDEKFV